MSFDRTLFHQSILPWLAAILCIFSRRFLHPWSKLEAMLIYSESKQQGACPALASVLFARFLQPRRDVAVAALLWFCFARGVGSDDAVDATTAEVPSPKSEKSS
eukprot:1486794-Amphidinium_carterae.1